MFGEGWSSIKFVMHTSEYTLTSERVSLHVYRLYKGCSKIAVSWMRFPAVNKMYSSVFVRCASPDLT